MDPHNQRSQLPLLGTSVTVYIFHDLIKELGLADVTNGLTKGSIGKQHGGKQKGE